MKRIQTSKIDPAEAKKRLADALTTPVTFIGGGMTVTAYTAQREATSKAAA